MLVCPLPHPLLQKHLGAGAVQSFCWDQGCSFLLDGRCRAQILSPSLRYHDQPCCLTTDFFRLAEKRNPSKCQSPYILFVQQSHYPHRSSQLCRASSKGLLWQETNPDREDSHRDNTEQTSKANEGAAGQTTTLLLG